MWSFIRNYEIHIYEDRGRNTKTGYTRLRIQTAVARAGLKSSSEGAFHSTLAEKGADARKIINIMTLACSKAGPSTLRERGGVISKILVE